MGVFARGNKLWIRVKDPHNKDPKERWQSLPTSYRVGQEDLAQKQYEKVQADMDKPPTQAAPSRVTGKSTMAEWAAAWLAKRKERALPSFRNEAAHVNLHIVPELGRLQLVQVRPKVVADLVDTLQKKTVLRGGEVKTGSTPRKGDSKLAPRTVLKIYGTLHLMMHDAVAEELIITNPCVLRRGQLPKKRDKDPHWREGAVFSHAEVVQLIRDNRIPLDRRVYYALSFATGMRPSEVAVLQVADYLPSEKPLGRINVSKAFDRNASSAQPLGERLKGTKTGATRRIPVHPIVAEMLKEWLEAGFGELFGRPPRAGDLLIPSRQGPNKPRIWRSLERFYEDLDRLGLRKRRHYDTRRTFISLCLADGARKDVLRWVSHGVEEDQIDEYTTMPWSALCDAVGVLNLAPKLVTVPVTDAARQMKKPPNLGDLAATDFMGAAGFEPPQNASVSSGQSVFGPQTTSSVQFTDAHTSKSIGSHGPHCNGCNEALEAIQAALKALSLTGASRALAALRTHWEVP